MISTNDRFDATSYVWKQYVGLPGFNELFRQSSTVAQVCQLPVAQMKAETFTSSRTRFSLSEVLYGPNVCTPTVDFRKTVSLC